MFNYGHFYSVYSVHSEMSNHHYYMIAILEKLNKLIVFSTICLQEKKDLKIKLSVKNRGLKRCSKIFIPCNLLFVIAKLFLRSVHNFYIFWGQLYTTTWVLSWSIQLKATEIWSYLWQAKRKIIIILVTDSARCDVQGFSKLT